MTCKLVETGAFAEKPLILVDVGARGGIDQYWKNFGPALRIVAFEPEPEECARLNASAEKNIQYLPVALGSENGERTLHVARYSMSSSFYPSHPDYYERFGFAKNMEIVSRVQVRTMTLRDALGDIEPDFIKLDIEGAEVDVLRGADLGPVLGIISELRFGERTAACPTFADLDILCRSAGFDLYDLEVSRFSRRALPYPYLYDFRDNGRPVPGPTVQGQAVTGDALYFRDGLDTAKPLKLACLFEVFGLSDCAAEVILAHRAAFAKWADPEQLLDLLVPEVKGERLSYRDHLGRHAADDGRFRPTSGLRFPDPVLSHSLYDGIQVPGWAAPGRRLLARLVQKLLGTKSRFGT